VSAGSVDDGACEIAAALVDSASGDGPRDEGPDAMPPVDASMNLPST